MAKNRYLSRSEFRSYLEERADQEVGVTKSINHCPVALYLDHATKREWHASPLACVPQVDTESGEDQFHLNHEFRTPKWAKEFMLNLDSHFGTVPKPVTGEDALYVLTEYA